MTKAGFTTTDSDKCHSCSEATSPENLLPVGAPLSDYSVGGIGVAPLTAAALAAAPPGAQKGMIRARLLPAVAALGLATSEEIVDRLLEMDNPRLLELLESKSALENEIGTATRPRDPHTGVVACESHEQDESDVVVARPVVPAKGRDPVAEALASDDCDFEGSDVEADQHDADSRLD